MAADGIPSYIAGMDENQSLFAALRQSSDDKTVDVIERLVKEGDDRELVRVNAVAFAKQHGLEESAVIGTLLHAARLGMFDLSWNVLCPGCGGVLDTNATLDPDIHAVHWFDYEAILARSARMRSPVTLAMIERYRQGIRYPLDVIHTP